MAPELDVHTIGTRVWVGHEMDSWAKGEVIKLEGGSLVIKVEGGEQKKCKPEEAPIQNPDTRGGVEVSTPVADWLQRSLAFGAPHALCAQFLALFLSNVFSSGRANFQFLGCRT